MKDLEALYKKDDTSHSIYLKTLTKRGSAYKISPRQVLLKPSIERLKLCTY